MLVLKMSTSCVLHPRLSNGEKSPLFSRLKNFLGGRKSAENVYYKAINPAFRKVFPNVRFDHNGEPLLEDLITQCGIGYNKDSESMLDFLNSEYGTKSVPKTIQSVIELQNRAASFNINNPLNKRYSAQLTSSGQDVSMEIVEATGEERSLGRQQRFNAELNNQLVKLLNSWGADVAALTELEEASNINGVMDLSAGINAATGLKEVIRISKRHKWSNTPAKQSILTEEEQEMLNNAPYDSNILAEEWGHFVVDAVKDSPLRDRMLNSLKNEEVLQRVLGSEYDRYNEVYKGDIDLMAKEALGKMMAQVLNNYDAKAPNDRLFERYKKNVLDFFGKRDTDEIDEIINKVREQVYEFTTNVFNGKYQLDISSRDYNKRLFNLGNDVSRDYNILKRIIQQERKRLAIYGKGAKATAREREEKKGSFDEKQKLFIDKLSNDLENHRELEGIYTYLTEAVRMLRQLSDKLDTVHNSQTSWKDKFSALRSIRDYMSSYGSIMEELRQEMYKAKQEGDMRFKEKLQESLDEFSGLLARLGSDWAEVSKDEFARFLTPFEGESISISIRGERKQYNIRELLDYIEKDISIVERWTDAMADSTDPILRIYDSLVKDQKNKARYNTINNEKEILMHSKKLEDAGIKSTEFMYEKTSDGKITGNFVTRYNWGDYFAALSKYAKSLPQDMDREEKSILISRWKRANTDKNGNPIEKYYNPQYDAIQRNAAMKEYYDFMINLKRNLDYRLPARYVRFNKAPQIRRDFLERVIGKGNKFQYLWESFKDNLVRREDDTEFAYARQDF